MTEDRRPSPLSVRTAEPEASTLTIVGEPLGRSHSNYEPQQERRNPEPKRPRARNAYIYDVVVGIRFAINRKARLIRTSNRPVRNQGNDQRKWEIQ